MRCTEKRKRLQATAERQPYGWVLCPLKRTRSQYRTDVNGRDVNGAARHRAVLRYIAKRHKVSAKIDTLHNARKRKRFPNANLRLGSLPLETSDK